MTLQIKKNRAAGLKQVVEEMSGVALNACLQCKKCTAGCPVAVHTAVPPSEIVRRLQLGAGDELLDAEMVWLCLSCETCYARCPMGINISAVIDAMRSLATAKGAAKPKGDMPLFNRMFLGTVKSYGRSYDLSMIMGYKVRSGNLTQDAEKVPVMLRKGKLAILPPGGANRKTVKRIFSKTAQKGAGK